MKKRVIKRLHKKLHRKHYRAILGTVAAGLTAAIVVVIGYASMKHDPPAPVPPPAIHAVNGADTQQLPSGQWLYLPGSSLEDKSLRILPADFKIVEQNGNGGQLNPPVNLFGTHFAVTGDFSIDVSMREVTGPAAVQFYGEVPIIYDEFRVERPSIRATITGNQLEVSLWNGHGQSPADSQNAIFEPLPGVTKLQLSRQGKTLVFAINGHALVAINESDIFASGKVWLGASAVKDSWVLSSIETKGAKAVDTSTLHVIKSDPEGLQLLAEKKRPGFSIGAAMALAPAVSDMAYAEVAFGGNFGSLTTENALKWQFVHPQPDIYAFQEGDALVALAGRHGLKVHGHTLVFGEANPRWVRDLPADKREAAMLEHIASVVGHYKGKIASWDVVNEPFDDEEWEELRPNIWHKAMGEGYIAKAFTAAHQADPDALLFMNDYGLEEKSERWDAMLALVKKLKQQGVPIHGVGFQAHVYERRDHIDPVELRKHIKQLATLGLQARISEMDVYIEDGQANQASQYSKVLEVCLTEPNCVSFTTWGVSDRYDMFKEKGILEYGEDYLWDRSMHPTPAVEAIRKLLR